MFFYDGVGDPGTSNHLASFSVLHCSQCRDCRWIQSKQGFVIHLYGRIRAFTVGNLFIAQAHLITYNYIQIISVRAHLWMKMDKLFISSVCLLAATLFGCIDTAPKPMETFFFASSDYQEGDDQLSILYNGGNITHVGNYWSDTLFVDSGSLATIRASAAFGSVYISINVKDDGSCNDFAAVGEEANCRFVVQEDNDEGE